MIWVIYGISMGYVCIIYEITDNMIRIWYVKGTNEKSTSYEGNVLWRQSDKAPEVKYDLGKGNS